MKTQPGCNVVVEVRVVHHMEAPQDRDRVEHHMLKIYNEIEGIMPRLLSHLTGFEVVSTRRGERASHIATIMNIPKKKPSLINTSFSMII